MEIEGGANYLFNEKVTDSSLGGVGGKMERSQEGMAVVVVWERRGGLATSTSRRAK